MGPKPKLEHVPNDVLQLVRQVCNIAASRTLVDDARVELAAVGVIEAVRKRDDGPIFDWLIGVLSLQGISDAVALGYIEGHEAIRLADIRRGLRRRMGCPKLRGYHAFFDCGYRKWKGTCAEPLHMPTCPLPRHDLRNGRLNRTAYSLALFFRDICHGDFVGWVDGQLAACGSDGKDTKLSAQPIVAALAHVEGIGAKVLSMALASLLLAADVERESWVRAGAGMIAIDSLVHNWMHRTGILHRLKAPHAYGEDCYRRGGCADLIELISGQIDARAFNEQYPQDFPRFVQHAIWRFCAQDELATCNGLRIKDTGRCKQRVCELYSDCGRRALSPR